MSDATPTEELDYLRRYPDVAEAVATGRFGTAREHFDRYGRYEGRSWTASANADINLPLTGACDVAVWSDDAVFVEGWVDDRVQPIAGISAADMGSGSRVSLPAYRVRRADVEAHLGAGAVEFGMWSAGLLPPGGRADTTALAIAHQSGGASPLRPVNALRLPRAAFFEHLLAHYGRRSVLGSLAARSFAELGGPLGGLIRELHDRLRATRRVAARAAFDGPGGRRTVRISLVCVLYGIPDFLFLLVSQFARFGPLDGFEFVFVSNSPELEEVLLRDAELAAFVFDASVRLLSLNQNCGFGHANNVGIEAAASDTIVVINPDVYPRDAAAVHRLRAYADEPPVAVAGGKLFYADGSVMHDGMFFARDGMLSALAAAPVWVVEHHRKGFPDRPGDTPRPVPAVSGALMVLDRVFARRVGLFDEDFIYGHYEDADLCLRVRAAGGAVRLDPALAFWHYEGRGSVGRPEHLGSGLYNRWLFSQRWGERLAEQAHD